MSRTLPVLAVTGAVLASLATFLLSGPLVLVIFPILAIITAVLFVLERTWLPVVLGVILALGGMVGFLAIEAVNTERVDLTGFNDLGPQFVVGLGLWVTAAALAMLWNQFEPAWIALLSAVLIALSYVVIMLVDDDVFGTLSDPIRTVPYGLFVLTSVLPGTYLLWRERTDVPPIGD